MTDPFGALSAHLATYDLARSIVRCIEAIGDDGLTDADLDDARETCRRYELDAIRGRGDRDRDALAGVLRRIHREAASADGVSMATVREAVELVRPLEASGRGRGLRLGRLLRWVGCAS